MKTSNRIIIAVLATLVAGILLSLPISMLMTRESKASTEGEKIVNIQETSTDVLDEEYIFVVLEDNEVPLAAAPTQTLGISSDTRAAAFFVIFALMLIAGYTSWYYMMAASIRRYSALITKAELNKTLPHKSFFNPSELIYADREIQSMAANRFF